MKKYTLMIIVSVFIQLFLINISSSKEHDDGRISPPEKPFLRLPFNIGDNCGVSSFFDHDSPTYLKDNNIIIFNGKSKESKEPYVIGSNAYDGHNGWDFFTRDCGNTVVGKEVLAAADGVVEAAGGYNAYGNFVIIKHDIDGDRNYDYKTRYGHLAKKSTLIVGNHIKAGDKIGTTGNTGLSFGTHLHFDVMKIIYKDSIKNSNGNLVELSSDKSVDPMGWWGGKGNEDKWPSEAGEYYTSSWLWLTDNTDINSDAGQAFADCNSSSFFNFNLQAFPWFKYKILNKATVVDRPTTNRAPTRFLYTFTSSNNVGSWAFWGLKPPTAGLYEVKVFVPGGTTPEYVAMSRINKIGLKDEVKKLIWNTDFTDKDSLDYVYDAMEKKDYKASFVDDSWENIEKKLDDEQVTPENKSKIKDIFDNRVSEEVTYKVYHKYGGGEIKIADYDKIDKNQEKSLGKYVFTNIKAGVEMTDKILDDNNTFQEKIIWADLVMLYDAMPENIGISDESNSSTCASYKQVFRNAYGNEYSENKENKLGVPLNLVKREISGNTEYCMQKFSANTEEHDVDMGVIIGYNSDITNALEAFAVKKHFWNQITVDTDWIQSHGLPIEREHVKVNGDPNIKYQRFEKGCMISNNGYVHFASALEQQSCESIIFPGKFISVGSTVLSNTDIGVRIRQGHCLDDHDDTDPKCISTILVNSNEMKGKMGIVTGSYVFQDGYKWWKIYWENGKEGWSAERDINGLYKYYTAVDEAGGKLGYKKNGYLYINFIKAYLDDRNKNDNINKLGPPCSDNNGGVYVHNWDGITLQNFACGNAAIILDKEQKNAYVVKGEIWHQYSTNNGPITYGAPKNNEVVTSESITQEFENKNITIKLDSSDIIFQDTNYCDQAALTAINRKYYNLFTGYEGQTKFRPNNEINRAELSKVFGTIKILRECPQTTETDTIDNCFESCDMEFDDLEKEDSSNEWYYSLLEVLYCNQIISGYPSVSGNDKNICSFKAADPANRAELLKFTVGTLIDNDLLKDDKDVKPWYQPYLDEMIEKEIEPFKDVSLTEISACNEQCQWFLLEPDVTRAEVVHAIFGAIKGTDK